MQINKKVGKAVFFLSLLAVFGVTGNSFSAYGQVEYVPVNNPVYTFLIRAEARNLLPYFSSADLPLQKHEIVSALQTLDQKRSQLTDSEIEILEKYMLEFGISETDFAAVFPEHGEEYSSIFSKSILSDAEKVLYHYNSDKHNVFLTPLAMSDFLYSGGSGEHYFMQHLGGRLSGTLGKYLGYSLQATNGFFLSGEKKLAMHDRKYRQNIKFVYLDSDLDFSNSHVIFQKDWFYAALEREERISGAGLGNNVYRSRNAPPVDAITLGVKFKRFNYRYTHAGLIGYVDSNSYYYTGYGVNIPPKYQSTHRFALRFARGEFALWESVVYSDRPVDFAYINPLSFLKSVEHSLRDRDNSVMGADATFRPFTGLEIKAGFLLDDLLFSEIGTDYWSNKTAWNMALISSTLPNIDLGVEYSKVDPFTYTHFKNQNSYTNDSLLMAGSLLPNSDRIEFLMNYWYGQRYPVQLKLGYTRHGENIRDEDGNMVKNVGANPNIGHDGINDWYAPFLDGNRNDILSGELSAGYEISRGMTFGLMYRYNNFRSVDTEDEHIFRITFKFNDF